MRREADQSRTDVVQGLTQSYCASTSASTVGMRGRVALARATNGARSGRRIAAHERVLAITGSLPLRFDAVVHAAARQAHAGNENQVPARARSAPASLVHTWKAAVPLPLSRSMVAVAQRSRGVGRFR